MKTLELTRSLALLGLSLALTTLSFAPRPALADEGDPTDVGLKERIDELTRPIDPRQGDAVKVEMRVGEARFLRDVARVDVTLHATNHSGGEIEWERVFPMAATAEVIGCSLQRGGGPELIARTLTFEDGRRIYGEAARPRVVAPTPGKDPLRVERERDDRLRVVVFPVAPSERITVRLSFVLPLDGSRRERHFADPLWLDDQPTRADGRPIRRTETGTLTTLLIEPGNLAFARSETTAKMEGFSGPGLVFRPEASEAGAQTRLLFTTPDGLLPALTVPGGGLGTQVAFWRFDPEAFLAEHKLTALRPDSEIRLTATGGTTQRLVPALLTAGGPAVTACARVAGESHAVTYMVEVPTADGVRRIPVELALARASTDEDMIDAVTGYYRAGLARHVFDWAQGSPAERRAKAVAYAVDLGVLLPGTAALAIPRNEQQRLSRESRRTFRRDGAPVGSPDGGADWVSPPSGSIR